LGALVGEVDAATTVIDFGTRRPPDVLVDEAHADLLVVRACYLALRRAARLERPPSGIVLVEEPRRALLARDVEVVVRSPVVAWATEGGGAGRIGELFDTVLSGVLDRANSVPLEGE
jgi:hypothetical protein